eukprot:5377481-Pyramimonas_sp.AAC.1
MKDMKNRRAGQGRTGSWQRSDDTRKRPWRAWAWGPSDAGIVLRCPHERPAKGLAQDSGSQTLQATP